MPASGLRVPAPAETAEDCDRRNPQQPARLLSPYCLCRFLHKSAGLAPGSIPLTSELPRRLQFVSVVGDRLSKFGTATLHSSPLWAAHLDKKGKAGTRHVPDATQGLPPG